MSEDPWGKRHNDGPPDLFELIKKFFSGKQANSDGSEPKGQKRFLAYALVGLLLVWVLSGIFVVSPAEQAVVLRFGRYIETLGSGPHWIPRIIESDYKVNVQEVNNFAYQSEMLTKDENIVSVALAVQYRVANLERYLFNVVAPIMTLQQATSSALRQEVGQMTLDSVLTTGRQELRAAVSKQLKQTLAMYKTGLEVTDVTLQPAKPPEAVTHAFDDAIKAREDEQRFINQSEAYARRVESIARGNVARLTQSANAYQKEVVLKAEGQTARFLALLTPYKKDPSITRERLYLDTLSDVLSNTTNILIDSSGNNVLYLPLDQIVKHQLGSLKKAGSFSASDDTSKDDSNFNASASIGDASGDRENRPSYSAGDNS